MSAIRYEPAIDGLRAIAISAVLLFHLAPRSLPGGFCGVDVFFVISGYLITSIQLAELRAGTFSIARFYQRRIARIFPALLATATFTLMGAMLLYDAQDRASAGANFTAAILSIENMKLMLQGNYFSLSPDTQPFMHFWSLSLEEQFYVVFPVLLMLGHQFAGKSMALVGLGVTLASFAACVALTQSRPTWAFFLLPTRAWELLSGGILAHYLHGYSFRQLAFPSLAFQVIGLLGLVGAFIFLNESQPFPGALALIPVLATVALIGGMHAGCGVAKRLLSHRVPVFIGRLSYSLYLWHWPINSFVDYAAASQSDVRRACVKVAATIALSILSFRIIESPLRKWLAAPTARWAAFALVLFSISLSPLGLLINREGYPRAWLKDLPNGGRIFNRGGERGTVALYGDSIAASFAKVVKEVCAANGFECRIMAVPAGKPVPKGQADPDGMWEEAVAAWRRQRPNIVIVSIAWGSYLEKDPILIRRMIEELRPMADRIVLLTAAPSLPIDEVRKYLRDAGQLPLHEDVDQSISRQRINAALRELAGGNVTAIDVDNHFVDENGVMRVFDASGNSLFQDRGHLAYRGTLLLKQAIQDELQQFPAKSGY
jgi:peptidoglycan/LPS O-acetylase OafA/YrhL